ncbi:hypothetical protein B0O99DRAFT_602241 [Bisporella sp. PMI_857]|nr:hypothetical protein B0O99DRAFT_602241 [Bisporella sp. PMI_857]
MLAPIISKNRNDSGAPNSRSSNTNGMRRYIEQGSHENTVYEERASAMIDKLPKSKQRQVVKDFALEPVKVSGTRPLTEVRFDISPENYSLVDPTIRKRKFSDTEIAEATALQTQVTLLKRCTGSSQAHSHFSHPPLLVRSFSGQLQQEAAANVSGPLPPLTGTFQRTARAPVAISGNICQPSLANVPVGHNASVQDPPNAQVKRLQPPSAGRYRSAQELEFADLAEMNRRIAKAEEDIVARVAAASVEERAQRKWHLGSTQKQSRYR